MLKSRKTGFIPLIVLVTLAVFTLFAIGGVVVWNKTAVSPATTVIEKVKEALPIPEEEKTKMPWEDSVCGNGICEQCESKDECCNYPCVTDPKTGNQMCPPPTCLGWCPQDCTNIALSPTPIPSCKDDSDCKNACAVPNFGLQVYHEVCVQGKCILEPCN